MVHIKNKNKTQQKKPNGAKQQAKTKEKRKEKRKTRRKPAQAATRERNPSQTRRCLSCRRRIHQRRQRRHARPVPGSDSQSNDED